MTSLAAQNQFGTLIDTSQRQPVVVTRHGRPVAVEHFVIAQNQATWQELETRIARKKFDRYFAPDGRLRHLLQIARSMAHFDMNATVQASRDASDDMFIALALDAGAKIIISEDLDLKEVKTYQGIEVLSLTHFFECFNGSPR